MVQPCLQWQHIPITSTSWTIRHDPGCRGLATCAVQVCQRRQRWRLMLSNKRKQLLPALTEQNILSVSLQTCWRSVPVRDCARRSAHACCISFLASLLCLQQQTCRQHVRYGRPQIGCSTRMITFQVPSVPSPKETPALAAHAATSFVISCWLPDSLLHV